ncbi:MAG: hypothetical protein GX299_01030 [Epulopiscium sp.]|nr:hypothetical protein [Candidatus Epulonipiscium sp.]
MSGSFAKLLKEAMWSRQGDVVAGVEGSVDGRNINKTVIELQKKIAEYATDTESAKEMIHKIELLVGEEKFLLQDSCYTQGFVDGIVTLTGLQETI